MGYKLNGVNTGGLPVNLVKLFTEKRDIPYFIETGTAGGESVNLAADLFAQCHTIEISPQERVELKEGIRAHIGDSPRVLTEILKQIKNVEKERIFFWLDAHYSGSQPNEKNYHECPLLKEIATLKGLNFSIVFIDDARLFYGPPPWPLDPRQWPNVEQIFLALRQSFPWHLITIIDDYIIAIPQDCVSFFENEWRGRYKKRYPDEPEIIRESVRRSYDALIKYLEQ